MDPQRSLGLSDEAATAGVVATFELLGALLAGEMLRANTLTLTFREPAAPGPSGGALARVPVMQVASRVWRAVLRRVEEWMPGGEAARASLLASYEDRSPSERRALEEEEGIGDGPAFVAACLKHQRRWVVVGGGSGG
jgi:hypothetical protein